MKMAVPISRFVPLPKIDRRSAIVTAAGFVLIIGAAGLAPGTPMRIVAIAALILAPLLGYVALEHPMIFPYGLYVALMPYDAFLVVHSNSTVTKMLGIATGLLCLFYCLRARSVAPVRQPMVAFLIFILWSALSSFWTVNVAATMQWLPTYFGLALLYCALALTPVPLKDFRIAMGIVAAAFVVAAIFGIHAFYHDPQFQALNNPDASRVTLTLGDKATDQNQFANAFLFPMAILISWLLRTQWLTLKALCAVGIGLMMLAIFMSGSREALIAAIIVIVYFLWRGRNRLQLLALTAACALAAAPFAALTVGRFAVMFDRSKAEPRSGIWAVGAAALKHYWIMGSGIGTFPDVYNRFYLAVAQTRPNGWDRPAHDLILHYGVELGAVGIALLAWFFIANFTMLRTIGRDHPLYDDRVMVEAGLIAIIVVSLFIDLLTYKYAWLVFASCAQVAYLATTMRRVQDRPAAPLPRQRNAV